MKRQRIPAILGLTSLLLASLNLAACGHHHDDGASSQASAHTFPGDVCIKEDPPAPATTAAALNTVTSCDDVAAAVRLSALREMNEALDRNLIEALALGCEPCVEEYYYGGGGGFGCGASMSAGDSYEPSYSQDGGVMADAGAGGGSAEEYSTTNNQVAEVDEPDFVKNDGAFIYLLANGKFRIIDAWPPEEARTLAAVPIEGNPTGLFVYEDRAVVYSSLAPTGGYYGYGQADCTYAYDCQFEGKPGPWVISVYDIADPNNPKRLRRLETNAALLSSRRIGAIVHTVILSGDTGQNQAIWQDWPSEIPRYVRYCGDSSKRPSEPEIREAFRKLRVRNASDIARFNSILQVPQLGEERTVEGVTVRDDQLLQSCAGWFVAGGGEGSRLLSLVSFDLTQSAPLAATTVVGNAGAVYATTQSLYVAQAPSYSSWWYYGYAPVGQTTAIHKFRLTEDSVRTAYVGSGDVEGHVLNQFSMDEHEGLLRVATSVGWVPDPTVHSVVTVLAEESGGLTEIGRLDDIARGEDIRSARFDGDTAYLVTFKKTDPLFVIDLSNPRAPTVRSELKVPGFSTYMQMMDDTHVLGIGFNAQDEGSFAWFQGIQLQVFDVTDPYNPKVLHKELIGTRGTTSDAATNHLAFNYFPPKEAFALPIAICEASGGGSSYGTKMTFDGLLVYHVTVADGFKKLGGLPHSEPSTAYDPYGSNCSNWWTTPNSGVKRSIFMDDYVWAIAMDNVRVAKLDALDRPLVSIDVTW
ncbi:MAG: beta-propeller domain-containing protein [Deltaproteobacteria bacterium]|nr:beta-propeller domain-containing protein [Deltaproteobacteria bacterium]